MKEEQRMGSIETIQRGKNKGMKVQQRLINKVDITTQVSVGRTYRSKLTSNASS